jgi:hypothetical protein
MYYIKKDIHTLIAAGKEAGLKVLQTNTDIRYTCSCLVTTQGTANQDS